MRKLALGFMILFLVAGCNNHARDQREIQGPEYYFRQLEVEFSDGTRVGCVSFGAAGNVSCVPLKGSL